jgi:putative phosphoribosyl transferase
MAHSVATEAWQESVRIDVGKGAIEGDLVLPKSSRGVVLFAHGSGSSRHSPRNRMVAESLHRAGFGTLLIDLLTIEEERVDLRTAHLRFDIDLLARRLLAATDWLIDNASTRNSTVGYFGASTGAAAALIAAAERPATAAVVSRGGRPDLAGEALARVQAATLLIVGSHDYEVIDLNRRAYNKLNSTRAKDLKLVEGATHLFEEPGALNEVADLAGDWFAQHLSTAPSS